MATFAFVIVSSCLLTIIGWAIQYQSKSWHCPPFPPSLSWHNGRFDNNEDDANNDGDGDDNIDDDCYGAEDNSDENSVPFQVVQLSPRNFNKIIFLCKNI